MKLSVIICTFNPHRPYLERTLAALRAQTLPAAAWELIVVDNNSVPPLASWLDLTGQPTPRLLVETNQGFTPALVQGVAAATGDLCVLVHDDNLLAPGYLDEVARIATEWPQLGAWGGGYEAEYETPPNPQLAPFLAFLAVNPIARERWSNALYDYPATPCGAGMAVRTPILRHWTNLTATDERRRSLGRHTDKLTSCEDFDIAFAAIDLGFGTGVFPSLLLRHLIPTGRVQLDYLRRLVEGHGYSTVLLHSFRGPVTPPSSGLLARIRCWRYLRSLSPVERDVREALTRGEARGHAALAQRPLRA
jgi:glycosyltransferase involved in cell wall biosynthesis